MEFSFSISDGTVIMSDLHEPAGPCRGVIVFLHGLGEHFGRYRQWGARFTEAGYAFCGADLPGHGLSGGRRGHIASFSQAAEIVDRLIARACSMYPLSPVILYGHSLGGGMALRYLLEVRPLLCCAIVTSPWLVLSFEPPRIKVRLARLMSRITPGLTQSSGLVPGHLSRDSATVEHYITDPLVHDRISVALFNEAVLTALYDLENASSLEVPLLLMHGGGDLITSAGGSRQFAAFAPGVDLKIWEGGYHELHNDIIREEVFGYIAGWLSQHTAHV